MNQQEEKDYVLIRDAALLRAAFITLQLSQTTEIIAVWRILADLILNFEARIEKRWPD